MSTLIATTAAVGAALLFGVSSVADQRSTKKVETRRALSPRIILDLVRQPLWLTAIAANLAGFALQVVALAHGSLALVQPILVCDLLFSVLIVRYLDWRRVGRARSKNAFIAVGVVATTAGVAGFLAIGQPSGGTTKTGFATLPVLAAAVVVVIGGCLVVAMRNATLRPLALALACGVSYGVSAFAVKLVTAEFGGGPAQVFTNWPIYVLAVLGPAGFILNQNALQQSALLAPVQAIITASDPVISIGLGIGWLDVHLRGGAAAVTGEVVSLLVMTTGIVLVAYCRRAAAP